MFVFERLFGVNFQSDCLSNRVVVAVDSAEILSASLHVALPWYTHVYTLPFLSLYPLLAYSYYVKYDEWLQSEEWTFLACVLLGVGHALSFLVTKWSTAANAWITTRKVQSLSLHPSFIPNTSLGSKSQRC
jgi:cation-transporting ATPase 13A1